MVPDDVQDKFENFETEHFHFLKNLEYKKLIFFQKVWKMLVYIEAFWDRI